MQKINFSDATEISSAFVTVDGINYDVNPAQYNGGTDLNAATFNQLQDNVENAINEVDNKYNYSTEEQVIGTWINNKPLYRKVISLGTMTGTDATSTPTGISNVDTLVSFRGASKLENNYGISLPTNGEAIDGVIFRARLENDYSILKTERTGNSFQNVHFVIEYTKTTD